MSQSKADEEFKSLLDTESKGGSRDLSKEQSKKASVKNSKGRTVKAPRTDRQASKRGKVEGILADDEFDYIKEPRTIVHDAIRKAVLTKIVAEKNSQSKDTNLDELGAEV